MITTRRVVLLSLAICWTVAVSPGRAQEAEKRLTKLLGSMEAVDRFYRMHFRALGQAERITHDTGRNGGPPPVSYDDLEKGDNWAKSADEVRDDPKKT